jgi:hypothetical protein
MRGKNNSSPRAQQKGTALLISLMIMVGLSLLGLAFVAISETENAIAVNDRNYVQARAAAETGVKAVMEMFQDAGWANTDGILPSNLQAFKTQRKHADGSQDWYKSGSQELLFDFPFKGSNTNRFWGDVDSADVWIKLDGGSGTTYLNNLSNKLFYADANATEKLRISEIRIYAPPWPGAVKVAGTSTTPTNGYFDDPTTNYLRFGVATIRVTAQKVVGTQVRAERSVKMVLAETPFPTVDGAIETSGSLVGQGNFNVYWGKILSEKDMIVNRPAVGLPWFDARNTFWFEYGYDSTGQRQPATPYVIGALVNAPDSFIATDSNLGKFAFKCTTAGTTALAASSPTLAQWQAKESLGATMTDGTVQWTAVESRPYRFDTTIVDPTLSLYTLNKWAYQLLGRGIDDPWLHARARNSLLYSNNKLVPCSDAVSPHPCDYNDPMQDPTLRYSNFFQNQYSTDPGNYPERIEAVFPTMDYDFWKAIAQSSSNQPNTSVFYFKYVGDGTTNDFQGPNGDIHDITWWLNAALDSTNKPMNGLGAGFYFFDTANSKNPQFQKGGVLTPNVDVNASLGSPWQMRGYIYLNALNFGTSGSGSMTPDDVYPMPGEPFRDIGFRDVELTGVNKGNFKILPAGTTLPTGDYSVVGTNNGVWDYRDYNENNQFDVFLQDITKGGTVVITRPDGSQLPTPTYVPVPWFDGCTPPDPLASPPVVPTAATGCSEPHEPYLNIQYPNTSGAKATPLMIGWTDPADSSTRRPKTRTGVNTTVTCAANSSNLDCTSNAYDQYGALVTIAPVLWGALYNEGGYNGTGNAPFYGAILMHGSFTGSGTPDVFFDECLAHGCLETQLKMQRVMATSMETDQ